MTQEDLAKLLGVTNKAISTWENGTREPNMGMIQKMADVWGISKSFIIDGNAVDSKPRNPYLITIPVLGCVVAGQPIEAIENIEGYIEIDTRQYPKGEYFGLKIKGVSMEPRLLEGDVVVVKKTEDVDSGKIAIILINGNEATCKQVKKSLSGITLIGFNAAAYTPHFYTNEEIMNLPVKVIGQVVESRHSW